MIALVPQHHQLIPWSVLVDFPYLVPFFLSLGISFFPNPFLIELQQKLLILPSYILLVRLHNMQGLVIKLLLPHDIVPRLLILHMLHVMSEIESFNPQFLANFVLIKFVLFVIQLFIEFKEILFPLSLFLYLPFEELADFALLFSLVFRLENHHCTTNLHSSCGARSDLNWVLVKN